MDINRLLTGVCQKGLQHPATTTSSQAAAKLMTWSMLRYPLDIIHHPPFLSGLHYLMPPGWLEYTLISNCLVPSSFESCELEGLTRGSAANWPLCEDPRPVFVCSTCRLTQFAGCLREVEFFEFFVVMLCLKFKCFWTHSEDHWPF